MVCDIILFAERKKHKIGKNGIRKTDKRQKEKNHLQLFRPPRVVNIAIKYRYRQYISSLGLLILVTLYFLKTRYRHLSISVLVISSVEGDTS